MASPEARALKPDLPMSLNYSDDNDADGTIKDLHGQARRTSQSSNIASLLLRAAWGLLAAFGLLQLIYGVLTSMRKTSCSCGNTVDEAITKGCKFDPIATAWLPDHCRDDDLIEEFNHAGPGEDGQWSYYTDWDKTATMTLDEVARIPDHGGFFFTTHEWHVKHCAFEWRKQWRSTQTGATNAARFDSMGHIAHCEQMFLLRGPLDDVVTGSGVSLNADRVPPKPKHHGHDY